MEGEIKLACYTYSVFDNPPQIDIFHWVFFAIISEERQSEFDGSIMSLWSNSWISLSIPQGFEVLFGNEVIKLDEVLVRSQFCVCIQQFCLAHINPMQKESLC